MMIRSIEEYNRVKLDLMAFEAGVVASHTWEELTQIEGFKFKAVQKFYDEMKTSDIKMSLLDCKKFVEEYIEANK